MTAPKIVPPATAAKLRKFWHQGLTVIAIADRIGASVGNCSRMLGQLGMRRPTGWKPKGFSPWSGSRRRKRKTRWMPPWRPPLEVAVETTGEREQIKAYLEQRGATVCPPAYCAPTSAHR